MAGTEEQDRWVYLALFALVAGAAVLRFTALGRQPLWLDEATDVAFANQSFWKCVFAEAVHPPLYRVLLHFIIMRFGDSAIAARFLPAVFGILTVPVAAILSRDLLPGTEIATAILSSVSPFLIFFSQENRDYSLFILLTLVATWSFWHFLQSGRGLALYAGVCILLLYTHYLAVFVLLAHEIVYWRRKRGPRLRWVWARVALFCAFAPWLAWAVVRYHTESRLFIAPALLIPSSLLRFFVGYGIAASDAALKAQSLRARIAADAPVVLPSFCLFAWMTWRGVRRVAARTDVNMLFGTMVLIPWATLVILAPWIKLTQERYLAFQAPFILMLIAAGFCSLPYRGRLFSAAALALVTGFSLLAYYDAPGSAFGYRFRYGKENWAGAAAFVRQERPDTVILAPGYLRLAFDRYPRGPCREIPMGADAFAPPHIDDARRVALVIAHAGPPEEQIRADLDAAYPKIAEASFPAQNMIRVIVYDTSAHSSPHSQAAPETQSRR